MNVPSEPLLSAYLAVVQRAIVQARSLAYQKGSYEQMGDLLDAVHVIPELLNDWKRCDERGLRDYLVVYDEKWFPKDSFSLVKVFEEAYLAKSVTRALLVLYATHRLITTGISTRKTKTRGFA